ncbi:hypothetical protein C3B44_04005 [Corynebacterium yudongzhengii]|uniref:Uncharacterized protein n=1 Tax=Corynebacterium yudongzhengii TaxID=2080740 RepID=A0A2U1T6I9_9CORY|nr:hypothetical protein [Corynebacterium yudongzhengii]AWB81629.1 hypothetical protein C3B44_04005 [Corynebacterium yudongzhengii]PWC01614.1 hypothetical protein DF222_06665 [Corynebacterium yudongzhengii]
MPIIQFDVLIPNEHSDSPQKVADAFRLALKILVDKGELSSGEVTHEQVDDVHEAVVTELRDVYTREHGKEPGAASMHRYSVKAHGEAISYNQLAMGLSRVLTPQASLPGDRVAEERHEDFEIPAFYPWTVDIRR